MFFLLQRRSFVPGCQSSYNGRPMTVPTAASSRPVPELGVFWAVAIVFLSNFVVLVLEIVAARLMAPLTGVSLYTWTSIIGVVLAGISIGNYYGGRLADRRASLPLLSLVFFLSGVTCLGVLWLVGQVEPIRTLNLPPFLTILFSFAAVFLLPSFLLGTIAPLVVKLTLVDLSRSGEIMGKIYAAGAAGSIAGTFTAGFVLLAWFGTRSIILTVAGTLFLTATLLWLASQPRTGARTQRGDGKPSLKHVAP